MIANDWEWPGFVPAIFVGAVIWENEISPRRHCMEPLRRAIQAASAEGFWIASLRSQ
jgi:hypothetical protein